MESDGEMRFVQERITHRDSDTSDGDNHLMVTGLYDDEAQERKTSISFDKIKQISLTYSIQGSEDEQERSLPIDPSNNNEDRRGSADSFCLSPAEVDSTEISRKVSVIELKNTNSTDSYRISSQIEKINRGNGSDDIISNIISENDGKTNNQSNVVYADSRYLDTNPFIQKVSGYEYNDQKASGEIDYERQPRVIRNTNENYYANQYKRIGNVDSRQVIDQQPHILKSSSVGESPGLLRTNVNISGGVVQGDRINYSQRADRLLQARSGETFVPNIEPMRHHIDEQEPVELRANGRFQDGSTIPMDQMRTGLYRPRSSASDRSVGGSSGASVGLKLRQHNNAISLVLFNETDSNIIISDDPESLSDESFDLESDSMAGSQLRNLATSRQGGGIDYYSEEELMNGLRVNKLNRTLNHRYNNGSSALIRDENTAVSGPTMMASEVARQIPPRRPLNQREPSEQTRSNHDQHNYREMVNEKFESQYKTAQLNYLQDVYDDIVERKDFSNQRFKIVSHQQPVLNQEPNASNFIHNQTEYKTQQSTSFPRQYRMANDKSANLIGHPGEFNGTGACAENIIRGKTDKADHSLVRGEKKHETLPGDNFSQVSPNSGPLNRKSGDRYRSSGDQSEMERGENSLRYTNSTTEPLCASSEIDNHEYGQPYKVLNDRGRIHLVRGVMSDENSFHSYKSRQKVRAVHPGGSEFVGTSIHGTPSRKSSSKTREYLDDRRRIDIVISSPKRYARPNNRHSDTRQFMTVSPSDGRRMDSNGYIDSQYRSDRCAGEPQRANQIISDYKNSPPSSVGSHSEWSNYSSYVKELDKFVSLNPPSKRLSGPNEGCGDECNKSTRRHQRNQLQKMQDVSQRGDSSSRIYTEDLAQSASSPPVINRDTIERTNIKSHNLAPEDQGLNKEKEKDQEENKQKHAKHSIGEGRSPEAEAKTNDQVDELSNQINSNKSEKPSSSFSVLPSSGCPFISPK